MNDNILVLKSINELLSYNFFIPAYQRGYRWTSKQVEELLADIDNFEVTDTTGKKSWYCLQPIVVRECDQNTKDNNLLEGTWYEVIDGQQRLTTIFLILHYANEMWLGKQKTPEFKIHYETREKSYQFLNGISVDDDTNEVIVDESNIDFYHISSAYKEIHRWVGTYKTTFNNDFDYHSFQSKFKINSNVIWYEVNDTSDSYDIFTRLNMGKIQLTNAELIKALFLKRWNNVEAVDKLRLKQLQIASEWDRIENTLQDDSFWYFIYNPTTGEQAKYANRIEYIFDLLVEKPMDAEEKYTFYDFYKQFESSKNNNVNKVPDTDALWLRVKKYFLIFDEWYKDRDLYHLIGYLVATNSDLKGMIKAKEGRGKTQFKTYLNTEIRKKVNYSIDTLQYKHRSIIKDILLLFNIQASLLNDKSRMRFPFDLYKDPKQGWDIEHVRSQTDKALNSISDRKAWAKDVLSYFTGEDQIEKQIAFIEELNGESQNLFNRIKDSTQVRSVLEGLMSISTSVKVEDSIFIDVYEKVCAEFNEDNEPNKCAISNLALLDSSTNRSYKNAFFPIKRKVILENDRLGSFIPLGTKNIFTKAYSRRFDEIMYWNKYDADCYLSAIKDTLKDYLPVSGQNNGSK